MTVTNETAVPRKGHWLSRWEPENPQFWDATGKAIAWRTLIITTANLTMAFIVWFMVSALVVRLPGAGFKLNAGELFWLAAMPGLAGGSLRIIHTFLVPLYGTRNVVAISTLSLLIPAVGWFYAVQDPTTPYWVLMVLAFLAGLGGANFSSFMPSTSLFFPKRQLGTALAIQAGIGNFGVSIVQFVTPWIIGLALFGSLAGEPLPFTRAGVQSQIWLQNAALVYVPFIALFGILAWFMLRSVPVRANFRDQLDIFKLKHGFFMTLLYIMTFGSFSGFSATFPLLIRQTFGGFPNAPDPLAYAFMGPLIGSIMRVIAGPLSDRFGGAVVTQWSGIGLIACAIGVSFYTAPTSMADFPYFLAFMLGLFFFSGIGNASTFKQMPMLFEPRQAAGVIGWTSAMAAYGPFAAGLMLGYSITLFGSPNAFFYWAAFYYAVNVAINWWYYARKGAPNPC
ncbi:MAG: NarK/NasA family nitrate transporter [Ferrovibrio sp.]|uniref:MFS transporter n=1 Tax=Ferrovibrio sp. TaxID=1917215 RepID=UPI0026051612|nr:nitrate/nitrite transporter [Ferrovibrio sp.]MCW0234797.1 NarK/NasA family nitrate transporter [Ferrovibrio sp.]